MNSLITNNLKTPSNYSYYATRNRKNKKKINKES